MNRTHPDLGPELQRLAQLLLDRLDPAVRSAAALAARGDGPSRCQQVWCPVCALAALVKGEQHPLLPVIAEHSVALLTLIRAVVENIDSSGEPGTAPPEESPPASPPTRPGRYQHIPVTVEE